VREQLGKAAVDKCLAGFYFSESATTRFYALILPRNEKGLKEVRSNNGRKVIYKRAQYFRVVRPATGVSLGDISFDVSARDALTVVVLLQWLILQCTVLQSGAASYWREPRRHLL
jgi:hypothetical protein